MPLINYAKPMNFCDSTEAVSVVLQYALVQLRDYVKFQENRDTAIVRAAEILSSALEDAHSEVEQLIGKMEVG